MLWRQNNNYAGGADTDFTDTANPADRVGDYFLSDLQFSVAAVINSSGELMERVSYDAYGEARHHFAKDIDGDGDVDATDDGLVDTASGGGTTLIYQSGYGVDADLDSDGDVDATDVAALQATHYASALTPGVVSDPTVGRGIDNIIGYCGYVHNVESFIYTVRFRHYDPANGRWLERDPTFSPLGARAQDASPVSRRPQSQWGRRRR